MKRIAISTALLLLLASATHLFAQPFSAPTFSQPTFYYCDGDELVFGLNGLPNPNTVGNMDGELEVQIEWQTGNTCLGSSVLTGSVTTMITSTSAVFSTSIALNTSYTLDFLRIKVSYADPFGTEGGPWLIPAQNGTQCSQIEVYPNPTGTLSGLSPATICEGGTVNVIFTATTGTGPFNVVVNGKSFNGIASGASLSLTHGVDFGDDPSTLQLTSITATNAGNHNCTTTGSPIHSIAGPTVNNITPGAISPADPVVCAGTGTTINNDIAATVDDTAPTYSWEVSQDINFGSFSNYNTPFYNTPTLNTGNLVNNTNAPITYYFRRRASSTVNGVTCSKITPVTSVLVNPTPTVDDPSDLVRCNGESASVNFTSAFNVVGTTFSWTNDQTSIGLAASDNGNIPAFDVVNTTNMPVVATIMVTPTANSCDGLPETFTITVNPEPVMDPAVPTTKTINSYEAVAINFATAGTSVAAANYTLVSITPQVGLVAGMGNATTGTGKPANAIAADTWVNESGAPLTVTYVARPVSADGCEGEDYTIVVTVNFLPVHNVTQDLFYQTIAPAIAAANATDVIELGEWTFNEAVTIDKSLTLRGSTSDKTLYVIDGTGLGINSGIIINNGVMNVTIEDLTVQDFTGSSGNTHGGIYAVGGNNGLTVDNVALLNNSNASGFYANGPVDDVSITNSMVSGNGPGARGIVIWNGLKSNITITGNTVSNNVCCGIELQDGDASAVNVSNNTVDIGTGDNAIGLVGMNPSVGPNTVNDNIVTGGGRFGIEIKNPAGGVTVDGNSVTLTTQNGDLRDRAGIAVFRRSVTGSNVDVPNGVTITANTVDGFQQTSTSEGFGIVIEGTNHTVTGNTVNNCEVGILQQQNSSGYPGDADQSNLADQYFGRGNSPMTCGNTISGNTFSGNGSDTRNITIGYGIVTNTTTNEIFCSIQSAINDAQTLTGHTLEVSSSTYNEQVLVNKGVTIKGVGMPQPIVDFTGTVTGKPTLFDVSVDGVTIENIHFNVDLSKLRSAVIASAAGLDNITVKDNVIDAYGTPAGSYGDRNAVSVNYGGPTNYRVATGGVNSVTFTGNTVNGMAPASYFRSGISLDEGAGTFTGNTLQTINHDVLVRFATNGAVDISGNNFNGGGVELADQNAGAGTISVMSNIFDGAFAVVSAPGAAVLRVKNNYNSIVHNITGNTFNNHEWAVSLENMNSVTLDNNVFSATSGTARGVVVNTKSISSNSNTIVQVPIAATLTNNAFNGNGTALTFQNHDSDNDSYGTFTIGSAGDENDFASTLTNFILFDNQTGSSNGSTFPVYPNTGGWPTTMECWGTDLDVRYNTFDVGAGPQLPSAMNYAGRTTLEGKLFHDPDASCTGLLTYFLPVHNLTANTYHLTIQTGIAAASANDVLQLSEWTFNERVVVDKSLTIQGVSKVNTIINGTVLAGTGSGIYLNNGVTNVTIKDLTVQNFAGSGPNSYAGIYAVGGNNNLTIENTIIKDNLGGSGIYANGPINSVTIDGNTVSGHTNVAGAARGIVIWNGLKENITITDNEVFNNNCCGIELQDGSASGVNISNNNIHDNADNGIGVVGLTGPGTNVVSNNIVQNNGRFGIEVKNPNGSGANSGAGSVLVDGNTVSRTVAIGDARDIAGIAVFRRGVLSGNVDVPFGAYVSNNTILGYTQPSTSEGFGIVVEGINHTVENNNVSGCDVGIQRQAGHTPYPGDGDQNDVADTYFGRGNSPYSCGITLTGNTLSNTIDTRDVGTVSGVGFVTNNTTLERFCTIQSAIDDANTVAGHTLAATAATYTEDVTVTKAVTLQGAGYSSTTISGPIGGGGTTVQISAAGAVLDGFTITRDGNNLVDWNGSLNSAGVAIQGQTVWGEIRNCNIYGNRTGIDVNNSNGNNIHNNIIDFNRTGLIFRNQTDNTNLTENSITNNWTAGVLFLDASGGTNVPVQSALNSNFNDNDISGNWYGDVVDRQSGVSLPAPGTTNLKDFECNWYGAETQPITSTANSTEPGYSALIPVAFGGTSTPPGGQPNILGPASANIDYVSWLVDGTDDQPATIGFQPVAGECDGTPVLITSVVVDDILCGEPDGSITVTFVDGTTPYDIAWTGGSATNVTSPYVIANLAAGMYSITVTSDNGSTATASATVQYLPVTNTTDGLYFATIQAAIDASTTGTGDVIDVCAGTYAENITVNKGITLNGPNAAISPNTGVRVPEAILVPATTSTSTGAVVTITVSNASVNGFKVDGDNPALANSGVGLGGAYGLSNDAARGIFINANGVSGITISKNIATKLENGIRIEQTTNYFASGPAALFSHSILIDDNKVENVRSTGIRLGNSMFAKVTNNTITNAENGIAFSSFRIKDMGNAADRVIENNTISARFAGIWTNLFHTSPYAINNNTISVAPTAPVDANPAYATRTTWYGIMYATVSAPQNFTSQTNLPLVATPEYWTCNNNTIDGTALEPTSTGHGYWLYYVDNNRDGSNVDHYGQISGGSVSNVDIGIFLKNKDTDPATNFGTAAVGAHASINGVSFTLDAGGTAIKLKDDATWTTSNPAPLINKRTVALNLGAGVTATNGAKGLALDYPNPTTPGFTPYDAITGANLNNLAFSGQTDKFIEFILYNRSLDATSATFDGQTGMTATQAQNFAIEDKVTHSMDNTGLGFVTWKASNDFVTTNTLGVQRGVDVASSGWTVNIADGTYLEDVNVNKTNLLLDGQSRGGTIIKGLYAAGGGATLKFANTSADGSTAKDMTITRDYQDWYNSTKNYGVLLSGGVNDVTLDNVLVTGNRNGVYVENNGELNMVNSIVEENRTGLHITNTVRGNLTNNTLRNNQTHGIYYNLDDGTSNLTGFTMGDNSVYGNWYSQATFRGANTLGTPADFECNWWGTDAPTVNTANPNELGYASLIPQQLGGTSAQATYAGEFRANGAVYIDYASWRTGETGNMSDPFMPTGICDGTPVVIVSATPTAGTFCSANGSIDVDFMGGTGPYTISWNGAASGGPVAATSVHTIGSLPAGMYGITVTDDNGSTATATATVENLPVRNPSGPTYYATIQSAIDAATSGDIIEVCAGTFTENLNINKPLTLNGPNVGVAGTGTRVAEAVLLNSTIDISNGGNTTLDGFHIKRTDGASGPTNQLELDGGGTSTVQNCIFERLGSNTGQEIRALATTTAGGNKVILNNKITGDASGGLFSGHKSWARGIYIDAGPFTVTFTGNTVENCRTAMNVDDYNNNLTVAGNTFNNNGTQISLGGATVPSGSFVMGANDFVNNASSTMVNLSNVAESFRLDITSSSLSGTPFSALSNAALFEVEARMAHKEVTPTKKGKVIYKANNQYVNNFTVPVTKIDKVQNSIKYGDANDIINLEDGTYNEKLTVDKSNLTLQGVTSDKTLYVIDGTGLGVTSGIYLDNGITNTTIRDLTVQKFTGAGGNANAGIYANAGNNNLTVTNVALLDNPTASGFYANGPIDNVSITNSMVANNGTGARGIVIWNGMKTNITVTGNTVTNNSCCGIELQDGDASAVNISNNTIDIGGGDNAIGAVGLNQSVGLNNINNNIITGGGRFGIEIKNPRGGVLVSGNNVALTTLNGDLRDRAGIAVFRRGVLGSNIDVPNDVTIIGNTVTGYRQTLPEEGFGIVIEGTYHVVSGNFIDNCDIGIQEQGGAHPNANYPAGDGDQAVNQSANYFGRGNAPFACGNSTTGNAFGTNGTNTRTVVMNSYGVVINLNTGENFCNIQAAINDAQTLNGHTLQISDAVYAEDVNVTKSNLTLDGQSRAGTIIKGLYAAGGGATLKFANTSANGSIARDMTITRDYQDWYGSTKNYGVLLSGGVNAIALDNVLVTGNRNGIYVENNGELNMFNSIVEENRTGLHITNTVRGNLTNNILRNNQTHGIFYNLDDGTSDLTGFTMGDNSIYGNWYSQATFRGANTLGTPADFECNWWGTDAPTVNTANPNELGYASLVPQQLGGTSAQATYAGEFRANGAVYIDYVSWRTGETGNMSDPFLPTGICDGTPVVITATVPDHIICGETTGSIEVSFADGTAPFDIEWTGGMPVTNVTSTYNIPDLAAGTYTITITDANGSTATATTSVLYLPVTNTTQTTYHATIQAAIDAAAADDIITVCAGTFPEQVTLNKKLDLRGANYGVPGNGIRGAETIVVPPSELNTSLPREWSTTEVVNITANGAKMDGFTISGDNTSINGYAYAGMNVEAGRGVRSAANDVTFTNNIVEKFTYIGFNAVGGIPTPTYTNLVLSGNKFDQIHDLTQLGYGFAMYIQATAGAVTNNVVTNSRAGIQVQPYRVVQGTNGVSVCNNNDFSVWTRGIYYNYAEEGASAWTIDGNDITAVNPPANPTGPVLWQGIRAETMRASGNGGTISNNTVNGAGVTIDNVKWWGNWALEYRGQSSTSSQVFFTGNTVSNVEIGFVHNAAADIVLTGNNLSASNKAISVQREYSSAGVQGAVGGINNIDATGGNTINGIATAGASTIDLFTVEDAINHKIDNSIQGLVRVKANELFVTVNSFGGYVSPTTTTPSIQRAVDIAATAETINVNSGNYDEQVLINKGLTLLGAGPTMPIVNFTGTPALASGKLTLFEVTAPNVTINNFQFEVDVTKLGSAVLASSPTLNNLSVINNEINPYRSAPTTVSFGLRNAISINVTPRVSSNNPTITVQDNTITYNLGVDMSVGTSDDAAFRSGVATDEGGGTITGNDITTISHDVIVRFGGNPAGITISSNNFFGGGVELSDQNAAYGPITVTNNTFTGVGAPSTAVLRVKNNYNGIAHNITNNTFNSHEWAVSLENMNTVTLDNNSFNTSSPTAHAVVVNTKSISSNSNAIVQVPVGATFTNNDFNGTGTSLTFLNHDSDNDTYGTFTLGTAGNENNFSANAAAFIVFDNQTGPSNGSSFPNYDLLIGTGPAAITTKACWELDLMAEFNNFDVGNGLQLPTAMTETDRNALETKLTHTPDDECLGRIRYFYPVHNVTQNTYHALIQDAIDAPSTVNGDVIEVPAGKYAENIVVNKSVTLNGPNANIDPCSATPRNPEAVLTTATAAIDFATIIYINPNTSNVTINGFMFDGDNTALTSGFSSTNGADIDAAEAISAYESGVNNLTVSNNIIQNLSYFGVTLYDYPAGVPSSGHVISNNLIRDMGTYDAGSAIDYWGGGVLLYNNQYAAVTNNCMTNVRLGIQTGNFSQANPGAPASEVISGNTIQARRMGVFHNLHYSNASPLIFLDNTITGLNNVNETGVRGMLLGSLSVASTIQDNTIDLAGVTSNTTGLEVWNVGAGTPATITGNTVSNVNTGLFVNNYEGYSSDAANGAHATISNSTINPNAGGTGIKLLDSPSSTTHASVSVTINSGVTINGGATGLVVENSSALVNGSTLDDIAFNSTTGDYIQLLNNGGDLDGTLATFDGLTGITMTLPQLFATEDKIFHRIETQFGGFVSVKSDNSYVTDMATPTATNNDYTRIRNAVELSANSWTVNLKGSFDWTETNAAASWALGNDNTASTGDDYSILVPADLNGVTFTAPEGLGTATIHGPGDLPTANLEGVLYFDASGDNQGWTMSNVVYDDFDLPIGMFFGAGGTDAYNNTTITNNTFNIATDLNVVAAPADPNQNIGIHYAFGTNQTISNNTFNVPGDGVSNGTNFATTAVMQSNTSGGAVYDGLQITGNTINILNAQSASPEVILGIWDNGHAHTSNITISNNQFLNLAGGNNPALNLQRAFRVTSHSGASSTVTYSGNTAQGANIGFQWLAGQNFGTNMPVAMSGNTLNNNSIGMLIQSNGKAALSNNDFDDATDNTRDVQVQSGSVVTSTGGNSFAGDTYFVENLSATSINVETDNFDEADNFRRSDKLYDALDANTSGLVVFEVNNHYVSDMGTGASDETITNAITAAAASGDLIHIEDGNYSTGLDATGKDIEFLPASSDVGCISLGANMVLNAGDELALNIDGATTSCTDYDQIQVNGSVNLGGATLNVDLGSYMPSPGDEITIIDNDAVDPVVGQFAQGATIDVGGYIFTINYAGGSGNDVVLESCGEGDIENLATSELFCSIQAAIDDDDTDAGHTIAVAAGTYNEQVTINKAITLQGANAGISGCSIRGSESKIAGGAGTAVTITAANATIDGFEITGLTGVAVSSVADVLVTNCLMNVDGAGVNAASILTSAGNTLTIKDNCINLNAQETLGNPTVGIYVNGASGSDAIVLDANNVSSGHYGYILNGVNTVAPSTVTNGLVSGVLQGVAVVNSVGGPLAASNVGVSNMTMNNFTGTSTNPALNFHAGVYTFTAPPTTPATGINLTVNNCSIDGTQANGPSGAAVYLGDFSTGATTVQNVTISGGTFANNVNRGVDARGYVNASISNVTFTDNGGAPWGTGGNDGFTVLAQRGATVTATNNNITHPATSTHLVTAFITGNTPASTINASYNNILANGNPQGQGAVNSAGNVLNAANNWWGDASGPSGAGPGTGASVSTEVIYCPWLDGASPGGNPFTPTVTIDVAETSGTTDDDGTICNGSSVTLDATTAGATTYAWTPSGSTADITVSPSMTTTYEVTVTIPGCNITESEEITVLANPTIASVTPSVAEICEGGSVSFTASGLLDGVNEFNYTVTGPGGPFNGTQTVTVTGGSYTFPAAVYPVGTYNITVNSSTVNGCETLFSSGNTATFTINPLPTGTLTAVSPVCYDDVPQLTFTSMLGTGPFDLTINGNPYTGIVSGVPFPANAPITMNTVYDLTSITDSKTCLSTGSPLSTFTVNLETTVPTISTCPVARNLEGCGTDAITGPAYSSSLATSSYAVYADLVNQGVATDACGIATVQYQDVSMGTSCSMTVTRTWALKDEVGNTSTCDQIITIEDTTDPVIMGSLDAVTVQGCGVGVAPAAATTVSELEALAGGATVADCHSDVDLDVTHDDVAVGTCPIVITRTYTVTDPCGNSSTIAQTITIEDTTDPVIAGSLTGTTVEGCDVGAAPAAATTVAALEALAGGATVSDCHSDVDLMVTHNDVAMGTCPIVLTRTYTVTDPCGNSSAIVHTITIEDTTDPVVVGTLTPVTVEGCNVGAAPAAVTSVTALEALAGGVTVTDCHADEGLSVTHNDVSGGTCPIVITRTYTVTDPCGNSSQVVQIINVDDNTVPTVNSTDSPNDPDIDNYSCGAIFNGFFTNPSQCAVNITITQPTWLDACDATITRTRSTSNGTALSSFGDFVSGNFPSGTTIVTFNGTDDCGNIGSCSITINVTDNQVPQVIGCTPNQNAVTAAGQCTATVTMPVPLFTDNCSIASVTHTATGATTFTGSGLLSSYAFNAGVTTVQYTVTDNSSNANTSCSFTVTVTDNQAPSITCPAPVSVNANEVGCLATGVVLGTPVVLDNCSPTVANNAPMTYPLGTTNVVWTATDVNGPGTANCTQTVTVIDAGINLNLSKIFIEGYMVSETEMRPVLLNSGVIGATALQCDTIIVSLHSNIAPYPQLYTKKVVLSTTGTAAVNFPCAALGGSYYIAIKGRNTVETWSAVPVASALTYSFDLEEEDDAYGSNLAEPFTGVFAIYSGDITLDGNVDGDDYSLWETDNNEFAFGYYPTDLNGDASVDGLDYSLWENNNYNFIFAILP